MILQALEKHAAERACSNALTDSRGSITYGDLYERVVALGTWLKKNQVETLAIDIGNGPDWVIADLACIYGAVTVVPVPDFFSAEQKNHLLREAGVDAILGDEGVCTPGLETSRVNGIENMPEGAKKRRLPAKVTFTSGSTGAPRGVVLAHESLARVAASIVTAMDLIEVQQHLCVLPLATLLENVAGIYAPLLKGIEVTIPAADEIGIQGSSQLDIETFCACLNARKPDSIILVPQLLMALVTLTELGALETWPLKMVAVGGGRVSSQLLEKARLLGIPVYEGYGLSEAASVATLNLPGQTRPGSVGKTLPHCEIRVSENGELQIRGTLMEGYLNDAPLADEWYATGDLGHVDDDGFVYIDGRLKNMFVTAFGRNVNPEWIEAELGQHVAVAQVLAYGEAMARNLALIWPRFDLTEADADLLLDEVNGNLPDYAQVHDVILMREPIDPSLVTDNGRLKRAAVIARYQQVINQQALSNETASLAGV